MADAAEAEASGSQLVSTLPKTEFIEDVAKFLEGRSTDSVITTLKQNHQELKLKESQLTQRKASLISKQPELERSVDIVGELLSRSGKTEPLTTEYELGNGIWASAHVRQPKTVNLWLGANVMLEYSLEEAMQLLSSNLENCRSNMRINDSNLDYIKDSLTITQVGGI